MSATPEIDTKRKSLLREYAEAIIIALVLALFIREFGVQAFKIPSGSMIPTLLVGDHILVNKFIYGVRVPLTGRVIIPVKEPARNDIIVFKFPENPAQDFIKRVIGVPGDAIEIINKKVYINGAPLTSDFGVMLDSRVMPDGPRDNYGPVTVPDQTLFVMGDNRDNSADSRFWGFVDYKAIKGKAFILYWSWNRDKISVRWNRIGDLIK